MLSSGIYKRPLSDIVDVKESSGEIPADFNLSRNYPNPFNPSTNLEFGISDLEFVSLKVFDISGKEVSSLVNEVLKPGNYKYRFDAIDLPSGTYFYRIETSNGFKDTKRMILIK